MFKRKFLNISAAAKLDALRAGPRLATITARIGLDYARETQTRTTDRQRLI
jgi:hypothetical protein